MEHIGCLALLILGPLAYWFGHWASRDLPINHINTFWRLYQEKLRWHALHPGEPCPRQIWSEDMSKIVVRAIDKMPRERLREKLSKTVFDWAMQMLKQEREKGFASASSSTPYFIAGAGIGLLGGKALEKAGGSEEIDATDSTSELDVGDLDVSTFD